MNKNVNNLFNCINSNICKYIYETKFCYLD